MTYLQIKAYKTLKDYRYSLTRQQIRTLSGQIKAGHETDAILGLKTILKKQRETNENNGDNACGVYNGRSGKQ